MTNKPKQIAHQLCACGCGQHPTRWDAKYIAGHKPPKPLAERLWTRVIETSTGCWEWQGSRNPLGYGWIGVGKREEGTIKTHRAAWIVTYGEIPEGLCVRHKCDNPPCCNPDHLELGTILDNNHDMIERGRQAKGLRLPQTKLSEDDVRSIRSRYRVFSIPGNRGRSSNAQQLANEYGISENHLCQVAFGNQQKGVK